MTIARVTMYANYGGQAHINVIHVEQTEITDVEWFGLGQAIDEFWIDWHRINIDASLKWNRINIRDIQDNRPPYDYPSSKQGVLGPSLQFCTFTTACFNFFCDANGRHGRGRSYVAGYGHGANFNSGQWQASTQNRIDGVAVELSNYWIAGRPQTLGWRLVLCDRSNTFGPTPVARIVGRSFVSSQVRRKIGRGA